MALLMADPARYAPDLLGFYPQEREIDRRYEVTGINPYSVDESTRRANPLLPISYAVPKSRQGSEALMQRLGSIRPAVPSAITEALSNMYELGKYGYGGDTDMTYDEMKERSAQAAMDVAGGGFGSRMFMNPAYDPATLSMSGLSPAAKQRILREVEATREFNPDAPKYYGNLTKDREQMSTLPVQKRDLGILVPEKKVTLESLLGQYIVPIYGDRSAAGVEVSGYGNTILSSPSIQHGGIGYARKKDNAIWNTDRHKDKLYQRAYEAAKEGKSVNAVSITMAGDSGDFNTMTSDIYFKSFDRMAISDADAKIIDDHIKSSVNGVKDWVGIKSPNLDEYLFKLPKKGATRTKLIKRLDSDKLEKLGLPPVDQVRRAQTAEELVNVPTFRGGNMIGRIDPEADLSTVATHPTYSDDGIIGGEYLGGLETPIPDIFLFPDVADMYMDEAGNYLINPTDGNPFGRPNVKYSIDAKVPKRLVDDRLLEVEDFYINSLLGRY
jgi:hypothetical protein